MRGVVECAAVTRALFWDLLDSTFNWNSRWRAIVIARSFGVRLHLLAWAFGVSKNRISQIEHRAWARLVKRWHHRNLVISGTRRP